MAAASLDGVGRSVSRQGPGGWEQRASPLPHDTTGTCPWDFLAQLSHTVQLTSGRKSTWGQVSGCHKAILLLAPLASAVEGRTIMGRRVPLPPTAYSAATIMMLTLGLGWCGRNDNLEPRGVGEESFRTLAVVMASMSHST
jgi:hypothetical protein